MTSKYKSYEDQILETFSNRRIFLVPGNTNGKYGIDGLATIAMMSDSDEVYKGSVFVFCNKSQRQLRFLLWENGGYWMITRKIFRKTFAWPTSKTGTRAIKSAISMIHLVLSSVGSSRGDMLMTETEALNKYW